MSEDHTQYDGDRIARLETLAAFLRSQANLTDTHPTKVGPGDVRLNHEEALLIADVLDAWTRNAREF